MKKALLFMFLLGVPITTSVPLVTMVQSAAAQIRHIPHDHPWKQGPGAAIGGIIDPCFRLPQAWEAKLKQIVDKKKEEYPDWSVAAVRNGKRLSGEGTCSMEKETVALCGIHDVTIFWGKHDRKCWFRNNGDGGYNNWRTWGHWHIEGKEASIGYQETTKPVTPPNPNNPRQGP